MTAVDETVQTKVCKVCGVEKPLTEFYAHKTASDGRQTYCKACNTVRHKTRYAIEKKGDATVKRSIRFLRGHVDPAELTDDEILGGYILEDDGTKTNSCEFEVKAKGKFNKELTRRMNRYMREKSGRALEVVFEIIDSDLVEPADRFKAAQWWLERIMGKTPEKVELSLSESPHESIFENVLGGSRENYRAQANAIEDGNVLEAEVIEDELVPEKTNETNDSEPTNNTTEESADQILQKRNEARELKKRIADQKRKRYAARAVGATSLSQMPWLIDWRVDDDGLRACLVAPSALTPARLDIIAANDEATNDELFVATQRANLLADKVKKAQQSIGNLIDAGYLKGDKYG